MKQHFMTAIRLTLFMTVLTGIVYPALTTGLTQLLFRDQANGSLLTRDGRIIGSSLIGQKFARPEYFHSRPSAAGTGYDPMASGGSNLGPTSAKLLDGVKKGVADFRAANPGFEGDVPGDAVLASASGLDPHITPANAQAQVARVAAARSATADQIRRLVRQSIEARDLGVLGEPRVNVLRLNLALDAQYPSRR